MLSQEIALPDNVRNGHLDAGDQRDENRAEPQHRPARHDRRRRPVRPLPQGAILFYDDERGFFDWLDQNLEEGFFLNTTRNPSTGIPMLHRASCGHIGRLDSWEYTKKRAKLCSLSRRDLEQWAFKRVGTDPLLCQTCFG